MLRTNLAPFGHRLAMDFVAPGGVARDFSPELGAAMRDECAMLEREVRTLRDIYDEHDGLQDRFRACGIVTPELAAKLGLTGLAGRASGQARDLRCDFPAAPYDTLGVRKVTADGGRRRRARRGALRRDRRIAAARRAPSSMRLPEGDTAVAAARAAGVSQGPRATSKAGAGRCSSRSSAAPTARSAAAIRTTRRGRNWPVLEHAVIGNIVPDFPLINKSFNLSYSGHDL